MNCLRVCHLAKVQEDETVFVPRKLIKVTLKTQMCTMVVAVITVDYFTKREDVAAASAMPATCLSDLLALQGGRATQADVYPGYPFNTASSTTRV